jgi:hypothetical protein
VDLARFELATSSLQMKRYNQLSHRPKTNPAFNGFLPSRLQNPLFKCAETKKNRKLNAFGNLYISNLSTQIDAIPPLKKFILFRTDCFSIQVLVLYLNLISKSIGQIYLFPILISSRRPSCATIRRIH